MINEDISEDIGINNQPEAKEQLIVFQNVTEAEIISAIKTCLKVSPLIKPSKTLINSVFSIMKSLFIDNKKYAILEAPTGSGKTIIGFMSYFCVQYLVHLKEYETNIITERPSSVKQLSYFMTSAKMLQEQIDQDLNRFDFREYIFMLKGVDNYDCTFATKQVEEHFKLSGFYPVDSKTGNTIKRVSYANRPCKGLSKKARQEMYSDCDESCPYQCARAEASQKSNTVLNYAYFLNVMKAKFNPFFGKRFLAISDEGHLIPDIVANTFNYEFTQYAINQVFNLNQEIELCSPANDSIRIIKDECLNNFQLFKDKLNRLSVIVKYFDSLGIINDELKIMIKNSSYETWKVQLTNNIERIEERLENSENFIKLVNERPNDIYFESEQIANDKTTGAKVFKHIVKDLSESEMVRDNFLSKLDKGIFMSATLGNIDEYAHLMGMEKDSYVGLYLPSQFDFSQSPIIVCKSGWLNYQNFDSNIDKVLMDCLKICNQKHPNEKGIIHTATFKISNLLKDKINAGLVPDKTRFLFYQNSQEKEQFVELMKNSTKPYIIVGPSLYEGLDLKDDLGRLNILIKVPYAAMTDYIKKKIERYPFWYKRNTMEKIEQAIGRTNRHVNDYSSTYLLDSGFDKVIYECPEHITKRIVYEKI